MRENKKTDLILDFDSTMVNSERAFCEVYNHDYQDYHGFIPANWKENKAWDFEDTCPLIHTLHKVPQEEVRRIFASKMFFDVVEFYDNAYGVLKELDNFYNLICCTAGTPMNVSRKVLWLEKHLPFIRQVLPVIDLDTKGYGKSKIDMRGAIFIDDHVKNLDTCSADFKILHNERKTPIGDTWTGTVTHNWLEISDLLLK